MYNLLTGKIPIESILRATHPLLNPKEFNSEITEKTEQVILKAMQIVPADRYQSVSDMFAALNIPEDETAEKNDLNSEEVENQPENDDTTNDDTVLQPINGLQNKGSEKVKLDNAREKKEKRKRKGTIVLIVIAIFACVGLVIAFWTKGNKFVSIQNGITATLGKSPVDKSAVLPTNADSISVDSINANTTDKEALASIKKEGDKQSMKTDNILSANNGDVSKNGTVSSFNPVTKDNMLQLKPQPVKSNESLTNTDAVYSSMVASGKAKMNAGDYVNARKDFAKAKDIKLTEEVVRLMITCDSKEADKALLDRRMQYEEKMTFGKYKIVRKKSTGKYGAIDTNVEERIPCKYLNVGIADNGRAFEREDGLFDIYNIDGALINKGVTYY